MTMTEPVQSLDRTSEELLARLDTLEALEAQRRGLQADDPRATTLDEQIAELASLVLAASERQRKLGSERWAQAAETSLDALPPRDLSAILGEWRDAERRARTAAPGSLEARTAFSDVDRLRDEYARAHASAARSTGDWSRRP